MTSAETKIKKRNYSLDIFKFISSIFVIFIHCTSGLPYKDYLVSAARFAVPVFFMISGYYSFNAIVNKNYGKIIKRILSLLRLYLIAELIYILYSMISELTIGVKFSDWIVKIVNTDSVQRFFLFNNNVPFGGLWFMTALIYVYFIVMIVMKIDKPKIFTAFAFIIAGFIILLPFISSKPICYIRNAFTMGLPLFSIGFLIKKHEKTLKNIKIPVAAGLTAAGFLITYAEMFILKSLYGKSVFEIYTGSLITAVFGIILSMNLKINIKGFFIENLGNATTYIYIFHMLLYNIIKLKFNETDISNPQLLLLFTIISSILLSYIIAFFKMLITKFFKNKKTLVN